MPEGVQKVTVTRPDKTEEPVSVRPAGTARRNAGAGAATEEAGSASATYDSTELAGIYKFSADGTQLDQAAFNVSDPDESDLTPRETIELAGGQKAEATAFVRSTKELWRLLCVVALVLVSLEWIVYHRRVG